MQPKDNNGFGDRAVGGIPFLWVAEQGYHELRFRSSHGGSRELLYYQDKMFTEHLCERISKRAHCAIAIIFLRGRNIYVDIVMTARRASLVSDAKV